MIRTKGDQCELTVAAGVLGYVQLRHNGNGSDASVAGIVTVKNCTASFETSHFQYSADLFLKGDQVRIGEGGAEGDRL